MQPPENLTFRQEGSAVCILRIRSVSWLNFNFFCSAVIPAHIIMAGIDDTFNSIVWVVHFFYAQSQNLLLFSLIIIRV